MTGRFARERVMHELKRRDLTVLRSETIAPRMQRITLGGHELEGFTAPGPADHVKVFFPDPTTGEIVTPVIVDGRPRVPEGAGEVIVRDYTPFEFRPEAANGPELDIDFVLHGDHSHGGPAASWAAGATPGDPVKIAGPRGSLLLPEGVRAAILVADESALPSVDRWLDAFDDTPTVGLFTVADPGTASYLDSRASEHRSLHWFSGDDRDAALAEALRGLSIDDGTFIYLAGEAGALVPLRRYLRRELELPKQQVDAHGYWKRGVVYLDHHAPLDPSDPD